MTTRKSENDKLEVLSRQARQAREMFTVWRELMDELNEDVQRYKNGSNELTLVGLTDRMNVLVDSLAILIRIERQIYGLDEYQPCLVTP